MRISMIGTGYVGLVSGACFADFGHTVVCADLDAKKIGALNSGDIPIYEPGLEQLVAANTEAGRLSFTTDIAEAVASADVVFIAVGTPSRPGDGHADLSYVHEAARMIARAMQGYTVVVNKSTVPVGTGDEVEAIIRQTNPAADFSVASNPEFLREGVAIDDFQHPDRVVIGVEDERARKTMAGVYEPMAENAVPVLFVSRRTSELIKYAANGFLAMKITFINEIADLCEAVGADVQDVAQGIGLDNRIGPKFLNAGPGYGGSCFPKDTLALVKTAQEYGSAVRLVETTLDINANRRMSMARKICAACGGDVAGLKIAILGITFKPDTDDIRESPAIEIINELQRLGAGITAYDPEGKLPESLLLKPIDHAASLYEAARDATAVVLMTEWAEFKQIDLKRLRALMAGRTFVDFRNVYTGSVMQDHDFDYVCIGRPKEHVEIVEVMPVQSVGR